MKKSIALTVVLLLAFTTIASAGPASVTLVSRPGVTAYGPLAGPLVNPSTLRLMLPVAPWGAASQHGDLRFPKLAPVPGRHLHLDRVLRGDAVLSHMALVP